MRTTHTDCWDTREAIEKSTGGLYGARTPSGQDLVRSTHPVTLSAKVSKESAWQALIVSTISPSLLYEYRIGPESRKQNPREGAQ